MRTRIVLVASLLWPACGDTSKSGPPAGACGDQHVDPGEECDDGNAISSDGCESASSATPCQFSCHAASDCADAIECNGTEICTVSHTCVAAPALLDGTDCTLGGGLGVCRAGATCVATGCGNTVVDGNEHCDDGNPLNGDGCENDCTFTCELPDALTTNAWFVDCDADGYATLSANAVMQCLAPAPDACGGGWTSRTPVAGAADCDDGIMTVRPGVPEVCDGIDNDCDDATDEGLTVPAYPDADGDGHGAEVAPVWVCPATPGYAALSDDCADGDETRYPGAAEVCNTLDDDCNALVDDGLLTYTFHRDEDGDGFGAATPLVTCNALLPLGYTTDGTDCYDLNVDVHPGQTAYFAAHRGDGRFDYDCNGSDDPLDPDAGICITNIPPYGACALQLAGWDRYVPGCGLSGGWMYDCSTPGLGSTCIRATWDRQQTCR